MGNKLNKAAAEHSHTPSTDYQLNTTLHKVIKRCQECAHICQTGKSRSQSLVVQTIDDEIQLLLEKGADFNKRNTFRETPLMIASEKGCCHAIQKLFDWEQKSGLISRRLIVDAKDRHGKTALMKAAEQGHVSVMQLLLSHRISFILPDYYGALSVAVYGPNEKWFDMHFFCKGLLTRKRDFVGEYRRNFRCDGLSWKAKAWLKETLEYDGNTTRFKEERVKLLLAINELHVNANDIRKNTFIELTLMSPRRFTSEVFKFHKDRGAILNSLEPTDEAPLEVARVDKIVEDPLHRLIISHLSYYAVEDVEATREDAHKWFALMNLGILLKPENFKKSASATDDKGRTPLHDAVMPPSYIGNYDKNLAIVCLLLNTGSSTNAVDVYGKTPLHYAENGCQYDYLVKYGADVGIKDKNGHTPEDLRRLRESVATNTDNAEILRIGKKKLYTARAITRVLTGNSNQVTELSKTKLDETVRIYSESPRSKESSEEAIWKILIEYDLNKRVSKLKPLVQRFIHRLADGIKKNDGRFECQPILVGSADEETKAVLSADFDFNFKLIEFSQLCDVFPHPLGPSGYFQLRRKSDNEKVRERDGEFDCFFNLDQCLLTNEVNSRFQIILETVLHDSNFWGDEHLFDWNLINIGSETSQKPCGLCNTVRLRMINPIEDGEGGFLFINVSIDIVACIHVEDSCFVDQLPVEISQAVKAEGCTLVFDEPRFDPSIPHRPHSTFSDTFSRISFAPLESRIIRESSSLVKAAYIVCKFMLYGHQKTTYQLKTALLFCMDALKIREQCERKDEDKIMHKDLAFWVEIIMFCFTEFYQHGVYPCYFMPSFKQKVVELSGYYEDTEKADEIDVTLRSKIRFQYFAAFDSYLKICPDDTAIDIPVMENRHTYDLGLNQESRIANQDPMWELFDRREFIRKLASRSPNYSESIDEDKNKLLFKKGLLG